MSLVHPADYPKKPGYGTDTKGSFSSSLARTGRWVTTAHATRTATASTLDRLYFIPLRLGKTQKFDRSAFDVTVLAATGVVRLGIYEDAGNWPGKLALDITGASPVPTTAVAAPQQIIDKELMYGLWWLALVNQVAAATLRTTASLVEGTTATPGGTTNMVPIQGAVSGALPAVAAPNSEIGTVPLVWLRAA